MNGKKWVDFDIHGLVGLRVVNPPPAAEEAIIRQLGSLRAPLVCNPDVVIRFVDRLPATSLCLLGQGRFGFAEDSFFTLTGAAFEAKARIPFDQIGGPCEIICEKRMRSVPLLMDVLKLTVLKKDCVPVHASAFVYKGQSFLLSSWAKGGKTTALLGFVSRGAEFVSDDCVLLSADGQTMYGMPTLMEFSDLHLETMPALRRKIPPYERWRVTGMRWLRKLKMTALCSIPVSSSMLRMTRKAVSTAERYCRISMSPQHAFGNGVLLRAPAPQKIFVLMSHQEARTVVEPIACADIVSRLASSNQQEQAALSEGYLAFKYAFPHRSNSFIESAPQFQQSLLARALTGKETYLVRHPYPLYFPDLYEAMRPHCKSLKYDFACPGRDWVNETAVLRERSTY